MNVWEFVLFCVFLVGALDRYDDGLSTLADNWAFVRDDRLHGHNNSAFLLFWFRFLFLLFDDVIRQSFLASSAD